MIKTSHPNFIKIGSKPTELCSGPTDRHTHITNIVVTYWLVNQKTQQITRRRPLSFTIPTSCIVVGHKLQTKRNKQCGNPERRFVEGNSNFSFSSMLNLGAKRRSLEITTIRFSSTGPEHFGTPFHNLSKQNEFDKGKLRTE